MESSGSDYSEQEEEEDQEFSLSQNVTFKRQLFELENMAKPHGIAQDLTEDQRISLEGLQSTCKVMSLHKKFLSIIQDPNDLRSIRVLFSSQNTFHYDYSLLCFDMYFHSFHYPTIFLRTGYPDAIIHPMFSKSYLLNHGEIKVNENEGSVWVVIYAYLINILDAENVERTIGRDNSKLGTRRDIEEFYQFLNYAALKYGFLEVLLNPFMEFSDVIQSYFVTFKYEIISHIKKVVVTEDFKFDFSDDSVFYDLNSKVMQFIQTQTYSFAQREVYFQLKSILNAIPSPKDKSRLKKVKNCIVLTEATQDDPQPPESKTSYYQELKDLRFNQFDFYSQKKHVLLENAPNQSMVNTNRLNKEIKILSQHLPCETTGAIFVVMDSERMDFMKVIISGTVDTPYSHGLYEFHIACPSEYPNKPPLVSIVTTGGGTVRFNPNLYDDGFVCLSVINTWDGDPSERWNPAHSNILQVLLSIQVLVMDNMIIQKEPEFEHLQADSWENKLYCNIVRYNNVKYAMLGMLKTPPEEFKQVIQSHFAIKRTEIMETVDSWLEFAKSFIIPTEEQIDYLVMDHNPHTCSLFKSQSYYSLLLEARNELLTVLNTLPSLDSPRKAFEVIEISEELANLGGFYTKMNKFQKNSVDFKEAGGYLHSLAYEIPLKPANLKRLEEDHKLLEKLKCKPESSIFVLTDSNRLDLLKIVVSAPVGTDYANGLFLFDVACPEGYPKVGPKVKLMTNGRFTVDFHPNLKKSGEVCGLVWTPDTSLLQYFKQIQLIFSQPHWPEVQRKHEIRYYTTKYAILDWALNPPKDIKQMVVTYIDLKKTEIMFFAEKWIEDFQNYVDSENEKNETKTGKTQNEPVGLNEEISEKWNDLNENQEKFDDTEFVSLEAFEMLLSELEVGLGDIYSRNSEEPEAGEWKKEVDGSEEEVESKNS